MKLLYKRLTDDAFAPTKRHATDAGWDVCAPEPVTLAPGARKRVSLGISVTLDATEPYYLRIADRSGHASILGLHVLGGVVDSGYRGDVGVVLINLGQEPVTLPGGTKIAQLIPERLIDVSEAIEVEDLDATDRGAGGFGSTDRELVRVACRVGAGPFSKERLVRIGEYSGLVPRPYGKTMGRTITEQPYQMSDGTVEALVLIRGDLVTVELPNGDVIQVPCDQIREAQ